MRPFRFGVMASRARSAAEWTTLARRAEELGYDVLLIPDHLGDQLSPFVALTAAAAATTRLRVGPFVLANDYRHPLIVAREAATLDLISGGRLELGLGAGWSRRDYRMIGFDYDRPGLRVDRLVESVDIVGRLLAGETVDHEGRHYRLVGARVGPRPAQRPRPPILIGGGGPRMLRLAARHADIVALQPQMTVHGRPMILQGTEAATAAKVALVREAAGDRFEQLELNVIVGDAGLVGGGRSPLAWLSAAARASAVGLIGSPYVMYGTLGSLREVLLRRRERLGISYYALPARVMETMAALVETMAGR